MTGLIWIANRTSMADIIYFKSVTTLIWGLEKHFKEQDGCFEQCDPVRLAQSEPHLFQTQIKEYFYDLTWNDTLMVSKM